MDLSGLSFYQHQNQMKKPAGGMTAGRFFMGIADRNYSARGFLAWESKTADFNPAAARDCLSHFFKEDAHCFVS